MRTQIPEQVLAELRAAGLKSRTAFIDPHVLNRAQQIVGRRGEEWAASVLGRSSLDPNIMWLKDGEQHTLVAADRTENQLALIKIKELLP
jgi:hypothetical protein